jgi:hypothetical protein
VQGAAAAARLDYALGEDDQVVIVAALSGG